MSDCIIKLDSLSISYGNERVIEELSYSFRKNMKYALTGESGSGKTTLLNCICGLIKPTGGNISINTDRIGYVFQEPRLFPWLTALENVSAVCNDIEKAKHYLSLLLPDSFDKYPDELSGGMKQRVSIARAMAYEADLYLIDEPFKGLDPDTREKNSLLLFDHLKNKTAIIVTHDISDTYLCDQTLKLSGHPSNSIIEINDTLGR